MQVALCVAPVARLFRVRGVRVLDGVLHGGESLLELVNYPAEKYNLSRIDKTEGWGIPSKDPLDEDDLAAAIAQLNELAQVQP